MRTSFCFEIPTNVKPWKTAKLIYRCREDQSILTINAMDTAGLTNFLYMLTPNATMKVVTQNPKEKYKFTAKAKLNDGYNSSYSFTLDTQLNQYYIRFVCQKNNFNSTLFEQVQINEKTIRYYILAHEHDDDTVFPKNHPLRKIGHWLIEHKLLSDDPVSRFFIEKHAYSQSWCYTQATKVISQMSTDLFWSEYTGYLTINLYDLDGGIEFMNGKLHSLVFIDLSFTDIIKHSNFIELDASFFALHPYVYSIPLGIIENESFPFALSIGPTESADLYLNVFNEIQRRDPTTFSILQNKPFLADEGAAIKAACDVAHIQQLFHCYRHLIQKFGASSLIGNLVSKLLFIPDRTRFKAYWAHNHNIIKTIYLKASEKNQKQFDELFKTHLVDGVFLEPQFQFQSIWNRAQYGVATCSNHIESCHSKLNKKVQNHRRFDIRLHDVLTFIKERRNAAISHPNLRREIMQLKKYRANCDHSVCENDPILFFKKKLYGQFPCQHQLSSFIPQKLPSLNPPQTEYDTIHVENSIHRLSNSNWKFKPERTVSLDLTKEEIEFESLCPIDMHKIQKVISKIPHQEKFDQDYLIKLFIHFTYRFTKAYDYSSSIFPEYAILMQTTDQEEAEKIIESRMNIEESITLNVEIDPTYEAILKDQRDSLLSKLDPEEDKEVIETILERDCPHL